MLEDEASACRSEHSYKLWSEPGAWYARNILRGGWAGGRQLGGDYKTHKLGQIASYIAHYSCLLGESDAHKVLARNKYLSKQRLDEMLVEEVATSDVPASICLGWRAVNT